MTTTLDDQPGAGSEQQAPEQRAEQHTGAARGLTGQPGSTWNDRILVTLGWAAALLWVFPLLLVMILAFRESPTDFSLFSGWTGQRGAGLERSPL